MLTTISITLLPETLALLERLTELHNQQFAELEPDTKPLTPAEFLGGSLAGMLESELAEQLGKK